MSQENMADRQRKAEAEQRWEEKKRLTIEECMRTAKVERPQIQLLPPGPIVGTPPIVSTLPSLKVRFWLNDIRYVGNVLAFIGDEGGIPTAIVHVVEHDDITLHSNAGNSPWSMNESYLEGRRLEAAERIGTLTYVFLFREIGSACASRVVKVVS